MSLANNSIIRNAFSEGEDSEIEIQYAINSSKFD